jgi:hypothetical protein
LTGNGAAPGSRNCFRIPVRREERRETAWPRGFRGVNRHSADLGLPEAGHKKSPGGLTSTGAFLNLSRFENARAIIS